MLRSMIFLACCVVLVLLVWAAGLVSYYANRGQHWHPVLDAQGNAGISYERPWYVPSFLDALEILIL